MARRTETSSSSEPGRRYGLRAVLVLLGVAGAAWSAFALQSEATTAPFQDVAERIALGSQYKPEAIRRALPFVDAAESGVRCSRIFHDAAIIRVQARRMALSDGDKARADEHLARAIHDLERDLACAPTRADSWFLLFAMRTNRDAKVVAHLPVLAMSYQMALNDGAIAPLRARAALPLMRAFGPNMKSYVENDFLGIAREQTSAAADIYVESAPSVRTELIRLMKTLPLPTRVTFAERLEVLNTAVPTELAIPEQR